MGKGLFQQIQEDNQTKKYQFDRKATFCLRATHKWEKFDLCPLQAV